MHAAGIVLTLNFRQELIFPFTLWANGAIADAGFFAHNYDACFRAAALQLGDGSDEGVATAVGLEGAIREGDDWFTAAQPGAVWKLEWFNGRIRLGEIGIDAIVNDADAFLPVGGKGTALKGRGADIPGACF